MNNKKPDKMLSPHPAGMRFRVSILVLAARLAWGDVRSPLSVRNYVVKFFPPPRVMVYKKSLSEYFSLN